MNLFTKQKQIHRLKEWTHSCQWGRVGASDTEFGIYTTIFKMDNQQDPTV